MKREKMETKTDGYTRKRRVLLLVSVFVVVVLLLLITWVICDWLTSFSRDEFREYIRSFGNAGWIILLGLQFLQVFIALIPGELLETAAGYVLGPWLGTLICYLGIAAASTIVLHILSA